MFLGSCILGFEACGLGRLDLGRSKTCGSDFHSLAQNTTKEFPENRGFRD